MKKLRKMLAVLLSAAMMVTTAWSVPMASDASTRVTVTISVEKFVLGQGYVVEPTRMVVRRGTQVSDVFESLMKQENKAFTLSSYGYYVDGIEDKNRGEIKVCDKVKTALEATLDYEGKPLSLSTVDETPDTLDSGDYCSYAGWMFVVNDVLGYTTMNETPVENGDVIRVEFSLIGGGDIDPTESDWSTPVFPDMPARSNMTRILGYVNEQVKADANYLETANLTEAYKNGHDVAVNIEATKEEMAAAESAFGLTVEDEETVVDDVKTHEVKKASTTEINNTYKSAISYAKKTKKATYGNEWTVITLKRASASGCKDYYNTYLKNLKSTLKKNKGALPKGKTSDYARVCIALAALGKNPAKFEGYNVLKPLLNAEKASEQGINGSVWALIALDACGYKETKSTKGLRDKYIEYIYMDQLADGGFAYSGKVADADMTAMVLTAVAPYFGKKNNEAANHIICNGIEALSDMQQSNGSFYSVGVCNAESNAQVVLALASLGINPRTDERFVKNGKSAVDALMSFKVAGGKFSHLYGAKANTLATTQATYALTAYKRFVNKKSAFFQI